MSDTFAEWQKDSSPDQAESFVCLDRKLHLKLQELEAKLTEAKVGKQAMLGDDAIDNMQAEVDRLRSEIKDKTKRFVFQAIGQRAWKNLEGEHPPTDEQVAEMKENGLIPRHNPETFRVAALAETCIEPGLTTEQAQWLHDTLPEEVFDEKIWGPCVLANVRGGRDPFDPSSVTRNGSGTKSSSPSDSASPTASLLGGK